jgi:hypothetical protein
MSLSRLLNPLAQPTNLWVSLVRGKVGTLAEDRKDGSVAETRPVRWKASSKGRMRILLYLRPSEVKICITTKLTAMNS